MDGVLGLPRYSVWLWSGLGWKISVGMVWHGYGIRVSLGLRLGIHRCFVLDGVRSFEGVSSPGVVGCGIPMHSLFSPGDGVGCGLFQVLS